LIDSIEAGPGIRPEGRTAVTEELETARLRLTPFAPEHVERLHALWTDPDVRRYLWDDQVIPRAKAARIVDESLWTFREHGFGLWALFPQEVADAPAPPDRLLGFCGFRPFEGGAQPELLYGILPEFWGEGLVTEACHAVVRDGFGRCGFRRIIAATDTPNQSSVQVMQRIGMVFEDRREYHGLDTVFYALSPEDYSDHLELHPDIT